MGTVESKVKALESAGVTICPTLGKIVEFIQVADEKLGNKLKTLTPKEG